MLTNTLLTYRNLKFSGANDQYCCFQENVICPSLPMLVALVRNKEKYLRIFSFSLQIHFVCDMKYAIIFDLHGVREHFILFAP
jgi:hypothetical protein